MFAAQKKRDQELPVGQENIAVLRTKPERRPDSDAKNPAVPGKDAESPKK